MTTRDLRERTEDRREGKEREREAGRKRGIEGEWEVGGVLIATAGAMAQRHRIAILTARNVYNFDSVSNNLFLSVIHYAASFAPSQLPTRPLPRPFSTLASQLIAKFATAGEITYTSDASVTV